MNSSNLDRLPVAQLTSRYDIGRTSLYKRLSDLNIKPHTIGSKAYVDADQLSLLDKLHDHLKAGHQTAEFLEVVELFTKHSAEQSIEQYTEQSVLDVSNSPLSLSADHSFLNIFSDLATALTPHSVNNISARLHLLQDACDHGWLLPTSELSQALQLNPKTLGHHKVYQRYGFTFTKMGRSGGSLPGRLVNDRSTW